MNKLSRKLILTLIMAVVLMTIVACGAASEEAAVVDEEAIARLDLLNTYCADHPDRCIVEGDPDSQFVIHEFSDYGCPHCGAFIASQYPLIKENLIDTGKIKYVTIPAPILGQTAQPLTPNSVNGMLCAADQPDGAQFHIDLFSIQTGRDHSDDTLVEMGQLLQFDMTTFEPCVRDHEKAEAVVENRNFAFSADVSATPTLYFNGAQTQASYQWLNQALFDAQ